MRIIAGDFRGRRLESPMDNRVRPTTDKVKEALFSIIQNKIYGRVFCDLFAGTGSLGLEALSRGAERTYFCDSSSESLKILTKNIHICHAEEYSVILRGDYISALESLREKIDIFLLDPPYEKGYIKDAVKKIAEKDLLAHDGLIIVEHSINEELPDKMFNFIKIKEKKYGKLLLSLYKPLTINLQTH